MSDEEIRETAIRTLRMEAEAISGLVNLLNDDFVAAARAVLESHGRLVVTGIGKSANIGNKIVATMNSTGTPAVFMHAADAIHGDLGNIQKGDIVMALSKSGNTPEIKALMPLIRNMGNPIIAVTGNAKSELAKAATYVLDVTVDKEACPHNLAPTTSTAAQLAMGDALAVSLLEMRGFTSNDFARFHPGGALGKRLFLRVADLCGNNERPQVTPDTPLTEVILEISGKRLGVTAVVEDERVVGVITDGDLRRMLQNKADLGALTARDIMGTNPKRIESKELAVKALEIMEAHIITQLLVTEEERYFGVIHLHDLLKEGIL